MRFFLTAQVFLNAWDSVVDRPLDPSGILCRAPLDLSAVVCLVKRKVESSIPPRSNFHPTRLMGCAIKGTWDNLERQEEK
jgi:hypothetical protein